MKLKQFKKELQKLKQLNSTAANKEFLEKLHKEKLEKRNGKNTNNN